MRDRGDGRHDPRPRRPHGLTLATYSAARRQNRPLILHSSWTRNFPREWNDYSNLWKEFSSRTPGVGGMAEARMKKRDEPLKIVKEGLGRLDALDKTLAAPAPDQVAAQAAAKEFGGNTCGACHKMLREGDAQTGFRFQAGKSPF